MQDTLREAIEIFHGAATTAEARFYARLPRTAAEDGYRLSGEVVGPFSAR